MLLKFIPIDRSGDGPMRLPEKTLSELIREGRTYDEYLQYQGFEATGNRPVYQGDVLELKITDELMDITKDHFSISNIGKDLKERPKVISVLCHIRHDDITRIGCDYDIYYMDRDRSIMNHDNEPEIRPVASGCDTDFPMYLCQKGAKVIANTVTETTDVFGQIIEYTQFTRSTPIPRHAVMNEYAEKEVTS